MVNLQKYNKFFVAALLGIVAVLNSLYGPDNSYTATLIAVASAFGVYVVRNK